MKKIMKLSAIFVAFALLAACFLGCDDGGGGGGSKTWTVKWDPQGGKVSPTSVKVAKGAKLTDAQIPTPSEFPSGMLGFTGWWTTSGTSGGVRIGTTTEITGNVTYYARYSATETIQITVNVNRPATYQGAAIDAIAPITMVKGAIGGSLPGTPVSNGAAITDMTFLGWYLNSAGTGEQVTAATVFNAASTIFAKWQVIDTETQFILTFDLNYTDASPKTFQITAPIGDSLGDEWPEDPVRAGFIFGGWWTYENGNGTEITSTTTLPGDVIGNKVWAKWSDANASDEVPPEGWSTAGVEKVTIGNGFKVIYRFELPAGKSYQNYKAVIAKFAVGDQNFTKTGMPRSTRIHGNYVDSDFRFVTDVVGSKLPGGAYAAADFNSGKNAEYIMGAIEAANQDANLTVEAWLGNHGLTETQPWDWFDVSFPLDGTNKHANFVAANMPAAGSTGPFAFGIGFDAMSGDGGTHYIKEVYMEGADSSTANLKGTPLYYKRGDVSYPAFCGYVITAGTNGCGSAYRAMMDGTTVTPVDVTPWKVTFNLNYTGAADPEVRNVERGAAVGTLPANPTRDDGAFFLEWNSAQNGEGTKLVDTFVPTGDLPVYAIWAASSVKITFDGDGGTPVAATKDIAEGGSLEAADLVITKAGFLLDKWVIMPAGTVAVTTATTFDEDTTIKALWNEAVTVTIALNNGAAPTTKVIIKGTALGEQFPVNPTRTYFDFTGWNTKLDGKGTVPTNATTFNENTTIYATWKAMNLTDKDFVYLKDGATAGNGVDADTAVVTTSATNATAFTAAWQRSAELLFPITLPAGVRVSNYASYSIKAKFYNADMEELTGADLKLSMAQIVFTKDPSTAGTNDTGNIGTQYNLGVKNDNNDARIIGDHTPFPAATLAAAPDFKGFYLQAAQSYAAFIEVYEIVFHGPAQAVTIVIDAPIDQLGTLTNKTWGVGSGDLSIVAPIDLDSYKWLVNGAAAGTPDTKLDFAAADYLDKINTTFTVTLLAKRAGKDYSQTVIVTVKK